MPAIVERGFFGAFHPRADVGGVTDTGLDGVARARRHQRVQRQNLVLFGIIEIRDTTTELNQLVADKRRFSSAKSSEL